jgi:hypothetical protein
MDNVINDTIASIPEPEQQGNYNKQALLDAFAKAQAKGVFKKITDAVTWQKQLRDEWE